MAEAAGIGGEGGLEAAGDEGWERRDDGGIEGMLGLLKWFGGTISDTVTREANTLEQKKDEE